MLQLEEAIDRILATLPPPTTETIALSDARGRVVAQAVRSLVDLPPFDNSAMDGYAVHAADVQGAKTDKPARLRLSGKVAAGEVLARSISPGECVRLFTGSPLPTGSDSVIMQEDTRVEPNLPNEVLVLDAVRPWENVRLRGEDVRSGEPMASEGEILKAGHLCLFAAGGISRISVARQPTVGLIATGSELREPGQPLSVGQIYESNRLGLSSLLKTAGAKPIIYPVVEDTLPATEQALSRAFAECDIVVTAGGASVGELDLIKPAFSELGGELDFWKVAMRPGRPFMFGRWQGKFLFGLPGNPVSALVTLLLLVWPAVRRWQGAKEVALPAVPGVLAESLANLGTRRHFIRVRLESNGAVRLAGPQESHMLHSFATAHGLIDVPPQTTLPAGTPVQVRVWEL